MFQISSNIECALLSHFETSCLKLQIPRMDLLGITCKQFPSTLSIENTVTERLDMDLQLIAHGASASDFFD